MEWNRFPHRCNSRLAFVCRKIIRGHCLGWEVELSHADFISLSPLAHSTRSYYGCAAPFPASFTVHPLRESSASSTIPLGAGLFGDSVIASVVSRSGGEESRLSLGSMRPPRGLHNPEHLSLVSSSCRSFLRCCSSGVVHVFRLYLGISLRLSRHGKKCRYLSAALCGITCLQ